MSIPIKNPRGRSTGIFTLQLAQRHDGLAVLSVQDLTHSAVDSGQAAEDAHDTGDGVDHVDTGEVTQSQQDEQQGQAAEDNTGGNVVLEGTDEHKQGENAPQQQVEAQSHGAGSFNGGEGIDPNQNQGPPEQAVSGECGAAEGVTLLQLTDTGDDLCQAAQGDTHSNDHDGQRQNAGVVQVQQNSCHAKAQKTQRAGIGHFLGFTRHM